MKRDLGDAVPLGRGPPEGELRRHVGKRCLQIGAVPGPQSVPFLNDPREHSRIQPVRNRRLGARRGAHDDLRVRDLLSRFRSR